MKRFDVVPEYGTVTSLYQVDSPDGEYVDADIAQELYDHLKHVVDQGRKILEGEEPEGDDEDFENWFLSACKTLEKADKE